MRITIRAVAFLAAALLLSACGAGTQSPASNDTVLDRAAGIGTMSVVCTGDMWERTRPTGLAKVETKPADGDRGARGLVRVTLTGTQLVDYLKELDFNGHPGWGGDTNSLEHPHHDQQIAKRMYDVLAPAVVNVKNARSSADPAPEVVVDDTLATAAP